METKPRKELVWFMAITFAFSWLVWLPGVFIPNFPISGKVLEILGALGPAVAALYLTWRDEGKDGLKRIAGSSFGRECKWSFLLWASLMLLALHGTSRLIYGFFTTNLPISDLLVTPVALIPLFIVMLLVGGGLNEEIGWRGYALDRLLNKFGALGASLILSVFWIIWHLPVFFLQGTNQSLIPFWLFMLSVIPLGVLMTWVYLNTNKSIFAAAFFHTIGNLAHELFCIRPTEASPSLTGFIILTVLYALAALAVTLIYSPKRLQKA